MHIEHCDIYIHMYKCADESIAAVSDVEVVMECIHVWVLLILSLLLIHPPHMYVLL